MLNNVSSHTQQYEKAKPLKERFPGASDEALDFLSNLMCFNPTKRMTAEQALNHPYLSQFHNEADEPVLTSAILISLDDNKRLKIDDYRKHLYRQIINRKKELRKKKEAAKLKRR